MDWKKAICESLQIFGSLCYRHIPDQRRKNLDEKSQVMIFVGYNPTGSYRLYTPKTHQIIFSRDVQFDEHRIWMNIEELIPDDSTSRLQLGWDLLIESEPNEEAQKVAHNPGNHGVNPRVARMITLPNRLREYQMFPIRQSQIIFYPRSEERRVGK